MGIRQILCIKRAFEAHTFPGSIWIQGVDQGGKKDTATNSANKDSLQTNLDSVHRTQPSNKLYDNRDTNTMVIART